MLKAGPGPLHLRRIDDARNMLAPVLESFTEGFATADLVVAANLLVRLSRSDVAQPGLAMTGLRGVDCEG